MIVKTQIANVLSLTNLSLGFLSIFLIFEGFFDFVVYLLLLAVVIDSVDGAIARKLRSENDFGKELDSFGDFTSFCVATAVFSYMYLSPNLEFYLKYSLLGLCFIFTMMGAIRLSKFNVGHPKGYFNGMPTTINGFVIPLLYLSGFFSFFIISGWLILSSVLMISRFKITKPSFKRKKKEVVLEEEKPKRKKKETPIVPLPMFGD